SWLEHCPDKAEVSGSSPETPTTPIREPGGRSSAGRASPLQGEGQEFESPRLHHLRPPPAPFVPLIRVLPPEATDQRIAGGLATLSLALVRGAHLTNWNSDRQKEKSRSSISPCCQKFRYRFPPPVTSGSGR